jgi:hypothetical protein
MVKTLRGLGVTPQRLAKLFSKEEEMTPRAGEPDLVDVYRESYSKALGIALQRQALRDAGLTLEERPHNSQNPDGLQTIVQFLKERPQSEKLSFNDVLVMILINNLGGGANKSSEGSALTLKDILPLLQRGGQLSVSDVVALLERAKLPPPPAMPAGNSGGLGDLLDESVKGVLRERITDALKSSLKSGPPVDWAGVAGKVVEAIQSVTQRIPSAMAPPPEQVSAEVLPPPPAASGSESPTPLGSEPTAAETTLSSSGTAIPKSAPEEFREGSGA